jgi:flagellar export protein FliJ
MPRFTFRLTAPLRIRQAARDEQRLLLSAALLAAREIERRQAAAQVEITDLHDRRRGAAGPGPVSAARLTQLSQYEVLLLGELAALAAQAAEAESRIDERRLALAEAEREVKQLEKLRERQSERHSFEEAAREARQLDALATQRTNAAITPFGVDRKGEFSDK